VDFVFIILKRKTANVQPIFQKKIQSEAELPQLVQHMLTALQGKKKLALYGDLGAGKTTFSKALCTYLGVVEQASSPTFSLINEYSFLDKNGVEHLVYHCDLYRLKDTQEAMEIGLEDMFYEDVFFLIEWPQVAEPILPDDFHFLYIETLADGSRLFSLYDAAL